MPVLLTAANDGSAAVWDVGACASGGGGRPAGMPRQLASAPSLHGGAGVFSLDAVAVSGGVRAVTAAKDGSAALATLTSDGRLVVEAMHSEAHDGVAKCVRWSDGGCGGEGGAAGTTFASCGNDGCVRTWDARASPAAGPCVTMAAFDCVANAVRWRPGCGATLAAAGPHAELRVFDVRAPAAPLAVARGHVPPGVCSGIYQPAYAGAGGAWLAACGPRARVLSLYDSATGAAVSRGAVDHDAVTLAWVGVGGVEGRALAAAGPRCVRVYGAARAPA